MTRKRIYTAVPKYLLFAQDHILRFVFLNDGAPLTPYNGASWLLEAVGEEAIHESQRSYIEAADEVWVFGVDKPEIFEGWKIDNLNVTDAVIEQIKLAKDAGIPVKLHHVEVNSQHIMTQGYLDETDSLSVSNPSSSQALY